jgi:uncharacterized membrane protein YtjA (UPF0391 family)
VRDTSFDAIAPGNGGHRRRRRHIGCFEAEDPQRTLLSQTDPTEVPMLSWSIMFLIVALIAGVLGFGGIAGTAAWIAQVLFVFFLILFLLSLITRRRIQP